MSSLSPVPTVPRASASIVLIAVFQKYPRRSAYHLAYSGYQEPAHGLLGTLAPVLSMWLENQCGIPAIGRYCPSVGREAGENK